MKKGRYLEYGASRENRLWGILEGLFLGVAVDFGAAALQEGREGALRGPKMVTMWVSRGDPGVTKTIWRQTKEDRGEDLELFVTKNFEPPSPQVAPEEFYEAVTRKLNLRAKSPFPIEAGT